VKTISSIIIICFTSLSYIIVSMKHVSRILYAFLYRVAINDYFLLFIYFSTSISSWSVASYALLIPWVSSFLNTLSSLSLTCPLSSCPMLPFLFLHSFNQFSSSFFNLAFSPSFWPHFLLYPWLFLISRIEFLCHRSGTWYCVYVEYGAVILKSFHSMYLDVHVLKIVKLYLKGLSSEN